MKKSLHRRVINRLLHSLARVLPGTTWLRPFLHRLRGVKIGTNVFIGDEVYLENEYPEALEIQDGVQISIRAIILAHTCGPGQIVIGKDAYIGPNVIIATSGGRRLCIGEGAVIGAGVVVTQDVPPHIFLAQASSVPVGKALVPLTKAKNIEDFIRGLSPIKRRPPS